MEARILLVLLVAGVLPVTLIASPDRLGSVYLDERFKRGSGSESDGFAGKYVSLEGDGIRFHSKEGYLSVTTFDGKPVFFASMNPLREQGFGYMNIGGKAFAFVKKRAYALSDHLSAQTLLSHSQRESFIAQLQEEDARAHDALVEMSLEELAQTRQSILMEETAFALGTKHGIIGSENPEVLPLYMMAMHLSRMRKETATATASLCGSKCPSGGCDVQSRSGDKYCSSATQNECPPCRSNDCFGMCGNSCCCWEWACGDCCWHNLCYGHDICCEKQGFWNPWNDCLDTSALITRRLTTGCGGGYTRC